MASSFLSQVVISDFRSFEERQFAFDSQVSLIVGPNGAGKTNLLEAISLLSLGRSFRASRLTECVRMGAPLARVEVECIVEGEKERLAVTIGGQDSAYSRVTRYMRNGVVKQKRSVVGVLKSVLFRPEDLELVIGSPALKREFFNDVLTQVSSKYQLALKEYEKALRHRNKLIEQLREGEVSRSEFYFWDETLIKYADVLTRMRFELVHFLNDQVLFPIQSRIVYEESIMSEERLRQYATAEVAAGKTLVGPHRDTFRILLQLKLNEEVQDVLSYGSRGQQRLAVLWLKMGQLQYIEKQTDISPVLLLDDIFSELDEHNRELIFSLFEDRQVILTSAEELSMLPEKVKKGRVIQLQPF